MPAGPPSSNRQVNPRHDRILVEDKPDIPAFPGPSSAAHLLRSLAVKLVHVAAIAPRLVVVGDVVGSGERSCHPFAPRPKKIRRVPCQVTPAIAVPTHATISDEQSPITRCATVKP